MDAKGRVYKFGDNIDTDVIIPARYLNTQDMKELAAHCMEYADPDFPNKVNAGAEINAHIVAVLYGFACLGTFENGKSDVD